MNTVEAKIQRYDSTPAVRVVQRRLAIGSPNGPITLAAATMVTLYDDQVDKFRLEYVHLQNVGSNPIYYAINSDASAAQFHEVLVGGTADLDGLGASAEFSYFNIKKLTVISPAGSKIAYILGEDSTQNNQPL